MITLAKFDSDPILDMSLLCTCLVCASCMQVCYFTTMTILAAGVKVKVPGSAFEGPESYTNPFYYGHIDKVSNKFVHVKFDAYIGNDGTRHSSSRMWWPHANFPRDWVQDEPAVGDSDLEEEIDDDEDDDLEYYDMNADDDDEDQSHLQHMVDDVVDEPTGEHVEEGRTYWPDNEKGAEIPLPARFGETPNVNEEKMRKRSDMSIMQFFFAILPLDIALRQWLDYTNDNRKKYFRERQELAQETGHEFKAEVFGRACPVFTLRELKGMLAIFIIKGVMRISCLSEAWSTDPNKHNEGISNIMSHRRLLQIWKFFRVADPNSEQAGLTRESVPILKGYVRDPIHHTYEPVYLKYDPMYWVRPLLGALTTALMTIFTVGGTVVCDEFMYGSHHHVSFHRCIPGKPNPHGILIFFMCSILMVKATRQQIYIPHMFRIYTGDEEWGCVKGPRGGKGQPPPAWRGYGEAGCFLIYMVGKLVTSGAMKAGTTIFGDRAFSSIRLVERLKRGFETTTAGAAAVMNYVGTCRPDRATGIPQMHLPDNPVRGSYVFRMCRDGMKGLGWWLDSKWVLILTSGMPWLPAHVKRRLKERQVNPAADPMLGEDKWKIDVETALPFRLYNEQMQAVDCCNRDGQTTYRAGYKCYRLWKHIFFFLLNTWIYAAYCLYGIFQNDVTDSDGKPAYKKLGKHPQKEFRCAQTARSCPRLYCAMINTVALGEIDTCDCTHSRFGIPTCMHICANWLRDPLTLVRG